MFKPVNFTSSPKGRMMMVYGPPGAGKSTFAATLAKCCEGSGDGAAVIIDYELGISDALRLSDAKKTELYDLSDPSRETGSQLPGFLKSLRTRKEVKLVILDTLSEMSWSLLRGICGTKAATLQMYGERKRQLKEILLELRNLTKTGKHVLVLSHQTVGEVEGLPGYYAPECPKRDRPDIVGQFDYVARLQVATKNTASNANLQVGDHYLDISKDPQHVTKCRFLQTLQEKKAVITAPGVCVTPVRDIKDVNHLYKAL